MGAVAVSAVLGATPGAPPRGCWLPGEPSLTVAEARQMLNEHGVRIAMCDVCQPEVPTA